MATKVFVGRQRARAQVSRLTVTTAATNGAITVTVGNRSVAVTPSGTNTTTTAAEVYAALAAIDEGEFRECSFSTSTNTVDITGPDDGAPITVGKSDGGSNVTALTTVTAPLSPNDVNDTANWDTASAPGNGDTAVFEESDVDALYNLDAFASNTVSVVRRRTHTGRLGLPDVNADGDYPEYRARHFKTAGLSVVVEQGDQDGAQQVRVDTSNAAGAVTVTVTGTGSPGTAGGEAVEVTGLPSGQANVLNVTGAGVAVSPSQGQASTVSTVLASNAVLRVGPGATLTTVTLASTDALIRAGYATLSVDRGGTVTVAGSGSGTATNIDGGTVVWQSSGDPGAVKVGSDGVLDLSTAPESVAPTSVELTADATLRDPAGRLANGTVIDLTRCGVHEVTIDTGTHYKLTKAAHT